MTIMIQIHDLTPRQIRLLNSIWAMETENEFAAYVAGLTTEKRKEVSNLIYMMMLAEIDEVVENQTAPMLAIAMLDEIGIHCANPN